MNGFEDFRSAAQLDAATASQGRLPFWGENAEAWDTVYFAGEAAPGLAKVRGHVGNRVDRKTIPGSNGAKQTHIGYEPAEVEIELRLWMPEHLVAYEALVKRLRPRKGAPVPLTLSHPSLTMYEINAGVVLQLGLPERDDASDSYVVKMKLREFVGSGKQKGNVATAKASYDLTKIPDALGPQVRAQRAKPSDENAQVPLPGGG